MAPHSSTLAWKIPWTEEPGGLQSMGSLSLFTFMHWRRQWQPTPVFLPGEFQGWGSLVGFRLWGHTESDMTEVTQQQQQQCGRQETWVPQEDPLEKEMAIHSSTLAWRIPRTALVGYSPQGRKELDTTKVTWHAINGQASNCFLQKFPVSLLILRIPLKF